MKSREGEKREEKERGKREGKKRGEKERGNQEGKKRDRGCLGFALAAL